MDKLTNTHITDANGHRICTSTWSNGPTVQLVTPSQLLTSAKFGKLTDALHTNAANFALSTERMLATFNKVGVRENAPKNISAVSRSFTELQKAGIDGKSGNDQFRTTWASKRNVDPALAGEIRTFLRTSKPGDAAIAVLEHPDFAAAALAAYSLTGLPASLRPRVEEVAIRAALADAYAPQTNAKATAAQPLLSGPDRPALDRLVAQAIVQHEAACAEVEMVEITLRGAVDFIAGVADVPREQAFSLLAA
ncbi:hypothetical protein EJ070_31720 [Mesorhizobium sp. M1E.F.Ca.ET.045.02.1.1]|uniref:hypothetical protein n=1 Tax=Mesorhizobium sp. M1E.F.Ca.ET.045.02.1.1 TaxID=2493672 RepID=UPI000F74F669|nr:hypothetical protein [Mesorhizobium sp. M1E.F.Ca.ET.045.02.1.1]AZO24787.1 hypothetical protein EJ070_31720 [Mesorhizobium sp. M1E.F.Ca.ET.045.02.1.1]